MKRNRDGDHSYTLSDDEFPHYEGQTENESKNKNEIKTVLRNLLKAI